MTKNDIKDLIFISNKIGENVAYVQGGGGNTSVKIDKERMAIKASGFLLKNMTESDGYSIVDYGSINAYVDDCDLDEDIFAKKIKSFVLETNNRPSIETGFHAILDTYVIHTHSVYANVITCATEGEDIAKSLFPDSLWIKYATPGRELTLAIKNSISSKGNVKIIFLQNHGIIVHGSTAKDVYDLHENINKSIMNYFNLLPATFLENDNDIKFDFIRDHILFPDQVIYTLAGKQILKTMAAKETLWAYRFILSAIKESKLKAHFLPKEQAEILLSMESEKHRQEVLKK